VLRPSAPERDAPIRSACTGDAGPPRLGCPGPHVAGPLCLPPLAVPPNLHTHASPSPACALTAKTCRGRRAGEFALATAERGAYVCIYAYARPAPPPPRPRKVRISTFLQACIPSKAVGSGTSAASGGRGGLDCGRLDGRVRVRVSLGEGGGGGGGGGGDVALRRRLAANWRQNHETPYAAGASPHWRPRTSLGPVSQLSPVALRGSR